MNSNDKEFDKIMIPMLKRMMPHLSPLFSNIHTKESVLEEYKDVLPLLSEENRKKIEDQAEIVANELNEQNNSLIGVQPMSAPSGLLFAMKNYLKEEDE